MTADRWAQVKVLFDELADLPESERSSNLIERCGADTELRSELERLLALHSKAGSFLESIPTAALIFRSQADPSARMFAAGDLAADRFRIVRFIGRGGMGEVYEAADQTAGISVAIKTIRAGLEWNQNIAERFRQEVGLARQVTHSNVCRVNDVFEHRRPSAGPKGDTVLILSMELLVGETLSDRIKRSGPIPAEQARLLVKQIASALEAAHRGGIIHRDLKSSNVMLVRGRDADLRAVVTDFGLAQHFAAGSITSAYHPQSERAGTPDYMAPEQLLGLPLDPTADVFAFGIVMYEMLTGQLPFLRARGIEEALDRLSIQPAPPSTIVHGLKPEWDSVVLRCLQTDPKDRFHTAEEVLKALREQPGESRPRRRSFVLGALVAVTVTAAAGLYWERGRVFRSENDIPSIAVLPFTAAASSAELSVVADGLADDLVNALSNIKGIRVLAGGSSFRFRNTNLASAGTGLKTRFLVTGNLREEDGNIRVSLQLVEAPQNTVRFGQSFERSKGRLGDLPAVMTASLLRAIGVSLSPPQTQIINTRQTANGEAFDWYLVGRRLAMTRVPDSLVQSLDAFDKAIALDPSYSLAMSEKAAAMIVLAGNPGFPPEKYLPEAERTAVQALHLSPNLAEAHLSLGAVEQRLHWNWDAALAQFREARDRKPGLSTPHHWLGGLLSNLGRHDEAIQEITTARDLDPLSSSIHTALGGAFLRSGGLHEAIRELELTLQMDPTYVNADYLLSQAYSLEGAHEKALSTIQRALDRQPQSLTSRGCLAYVLAESGRQSEALAIVADLELRWPKEYFPPYVLAQSYAGLGDYEKAASWLRVALDTRDPSLVILKVDPVLAAMRTRSDFQELVRRLRL